MKKPKNAKLLAEKVKTLREKKGLTKERLAYSVGIAKQTVCDVENATTDPRLTSLEKIAEGLGVSVGKLLEFKEPKSTTYS